MIRIEVEAINAAHARAQLQELLRMYPSDLIEKFQIRSDAVEFKPEVTALERAVITQELIPIVPVEGSGAALIYHDDPKKPAVAETQPNTLTAAEPARRGRGRPPKNKQNSDAQPAVAENTGSGSAGNETPPAGTVQEPTAAVTEGTAETVPAVVQAASSVAANEPTAAQMRASLQAMVEAAPTPNEGQQKARDILAEFQVRKVGEVKPEQHAAIIAKAVGATAVYKQAE